MGQRLNVDVMSAHYYGQSIGDTYTFQDYGAPQGETVWYWLEELTDEPATLLHGPVTPGGGPAVMQRTPDTLYYDVYRSYYYLGGQRIAQRRQSPALFLDELLYLFTDHLGTVRLETYGNGPSEGQMRAATPTLPYGGQRSAAPESRHWYTGQYFDRSEDLYDYGARPYDPLLGLFIQPDTVVPNPGDPQSLNRYAYTLNNPVRYTDPTGHCVTNDQGITRGDAYDCTVDEMSQLTWETRKWWLEMFMKESSVNWFQNILGILDYFGSDRQFFSLDGWASLADAGVLVVIQDGWRQINGDSVIENSPGALQASSAWREFFYLRAKWGDDASVVASQWGLAEQGGVNFGTSIAEPLKAGVDPLTDIKIDTFVAFGYGYRWAISSYADLAISLRVFDPRTEQSRNFVYGVSKNAISPFASGLWGLFQSGGTTYGPY